MNKPAITNLEIHPIIKKRWSPRSFQTDKPVEPEKLQRIFEAARWAPSSFNEQPWRFIVGTRNDSTKAGDSKADVGKSDGSTADAGNSDGSMGGAGRSDETWEKLFGTLAEFNQKWAHLAPVLVLTMGKKTYAKTGKPNKVHKYDLGASAAYMTFQAYSEGLVMHQMGGFDKQKAIAAFDIPEDYEPVSTIAIGYQDVPEKLIPEMEESERAKRTRHEIDQFVFSGRFGQAFPFPGK
jgi:nitroreductase